MKALLTAALCASLTLSVGAADTVVTKSKHTDSIDVQGMQQAAEDQTEVTWIGKDRMRVDVGNWSTIVRNDLKKVYQVNHETKRYSVVDLPIDLTKHMTPEQAKLLEKSQAQVTVTVVATAETRKIKGWNATKYVLTMTVPRRGTFIEAIWATNDTGIAAGPWSQMWGARMSLLPIGGMMAKEMEKIVGVPVLFERAQTIGENTFQGRDEVVSIESKEPTEGFYEPPKDYAEKPFELIDGSMKTAPPVAVEVRPIPPEPAPVGPPPVPNPK